MKLGSSKKLSSEFTIIKCFGGKIIDKCIKAFIHPGIFSFVAANDHREPGMTKFMISYAPKTGCQQN